MKHLLLATLLSLLFITQVYSDQPRYSRISISADVDPMEIGELGIAVDNMDYRPGAYFIGEYSEFELQKLDDAGIPYEVLIWDMAYFYQARNQDADKAAIEEKMRSKAGKQYQTPENFTLGSMGGYHTNSEAMEDLDLMKIMYPELISVRQPISETITTHECRQVYWVRISNNPEQLQEKPRVLYTALTHAREPASLQQMLYQMWYLLENYGTDPEVTYLVDNLEMYFVPVVNPDGYIYNYTTNPNGGGMHRKNMRVNAPGNYGVDLNRNFGYMWGYDNSGSSPTSTSMTYRGPAPFSEPETQMLKQFAETYNFKLALNNHTYSDLLIYPWGYKDELTPAPDATIFNQFAKLLTRENNYTYGTVYETLNYHANGGSDDWFYGEQTTKDKVYAFTPEAGSPADGFWPAMHRIEDICAGHTGMNLYLARLALPYAEITAKVEKSVKSQVFYYPFEVKAYGLDTTATFTVTINPISPLITGVGQAVSFENMGLLEVRQDSILIELHPSTYDGLLFDFEVVLDNGSFAWRDTISRAFGWPNYVFYDEFENESSWNSSTWGLTSQEYYSAPNSMADSPGSNYPNNYNAVITLKDTIDLTGKSMAFVSFFARWNVETNYDYVQFRVSEDYGQTWIPLPGQFTKTGSSNQDSGQPVYHGSQLNWVNEQISLDDYLGKQIMLGFRMVSDHTVNREGFFFDNFGVAALTSYNPVPPVIIGQVEMELEKGQSFLMDHDMLTVEDDFVTYPQGHTITIHSGEYYTADGFTIIPDLDFVGDMDVKVSVNNGIMDSDIYDFVVNYSAPVNVDGPDSFLPRVYFSSSYNHLTIEPGDKLPAGAYLLILYDIFGREIFRRDLQNDNNIIVIPLSLKPGIYLFDLQGEKVISGKIPAF